MLSECRERQSIGTLEELANCGSNNLQVGFGSKELELVLSLVDPQYRDWLVPYRQISRSQLTAIIDRVRNLILDWALDLEKNRILGEGMTFSDEEKKRASSTAITVHGNFQGIIGDVRESKLSQDFVMTIEAGNLESLSKNLGRLGVPAAEITQLQSAIEADPMPTQRGAFGPNVAQWFGNLIGRVSGGAYQLAIGAGGDLLANSIWAYYGF